MLVVESENALGGLSKSIQLWNRRVDLGPHRFFSKNKKVNSFWLEMTQNDYAIIERKTSILFENKFLDYPLTAGSVFKALNGVQIAGIIASYLKRCLWPLRSEKSFADVIINRFGDRLFEIFFRGYTEKVWGVACDLLDKDFAIQRINNFSLFAALKNILFKDRNIHKTLLSHFAYPNRSAGIVYEHMAAEICKNGGKILFNTKVAKVNFDRSQTSVKSVTLTDGSEIRADHCISTMPINTLLAKSFQNEIQLAKIVSSLKFRNTILVYLNIKETDLFAEQWIYVNAKNLTIGRITNFNNWNKGPFGETLLCLELWCNSEDSIWKQTNSKISELAIKDFKSLERFRNVTVQDTHIIKIPNSYPIYTKNYRSVIDEVDNFLMRFKNLICIGRAGAFRYNNQDHSILMGFLAYENIAHQAAHNTWKVNLESEYFEAVRLDETGLERPEGS